MICVATLLSRSIRRRITWVGSLRDRIRHPTRHADLRRRLQQIGVPKAILVVCAGNVCRSPYLEAVLKRELPDVTITSAGFFGADRAVPPFALEVSASRGVDLSNFRSATVQPRMARQADLVIVMDASQASYISRYMGVSRRRTIIAGDLDPQPSATRSIEDPWQQPIDVFVSTFDRLDRCAATFVAVLRSTSQSQIATPSMTTHAPQSAQSSASATVRVPQLTI
jgi:protein-tyrosine phosphatase